MLNYFFDRASFEGTKGRRALQPGEIEGSWQMGFKFRWSPASISVLAYVLCGFGFNGSSGISFAESGLKLTLEEYLEQVRQKDSSIRAHEISSDSFRSRAIEGSLLRSPQLFSELQWASDSKVPNTSLMSFDRIDSTLATLGVSQETNWGMRARIYYQLTSISYQNPVVPPLPGLSSLINTRSFYETRPVLELQQPLWGGGFGRSTRAQIQAVEAQSIAQHHQALFQIKAKLIDAELTYWRLAILRRAKELQYQAKERFQKIYDYSLRRKKMNLSDEADLLQATAALRLRDLEAQTVSDDEKTASREFNLKRSSEAPHVEESLSDLPRDRISGGPISSFELKNREDYMAEEQKQEALLASAQIAVERNLPSLEVFSSLALNGKGYGFGSSLTDPFRPSKSSYAVGMRFSAPLEFGLLKQVRSGWAQQQESSRLELSRRGFELRQEYDLLNEKLRRSREKLAFAKSLVSVQGEKVLREKWRLENGRTTTFQYLMFQQDLIQSEIVMLNIEGEILGLLTQLKFFSEVRR